MDAIDRAKRGDLKFLKEAPVDILLNARDSYDDSVLSMVVDDNRLDCCEVICKRCPSLLYHQPRQGGNTPLHNAAYSGNFDILKLLISACDEADQGVDRAGKQKTLTLRTTSNGYNAMHKAIYGRQPNSIKLLIEADPNNELLRAGDRKNNSPLHLAVETNQLEIARLLIKADPDFPYGANLNGKTPLFIAIDKAESRNNREMLKLIMELQPSQSMSCPESSKVVANGGQNFFHYAVESGNVEMVKHILGMKEITSTVLNSPDNLGRTPLDVAAISENERMILCLHEDHRVNKKLLMGSNLNWVVEKKNFGMMNMFIETHSDFLMKDIQNSEKSGTILLKAAQENHLFICIELYKRCPSLIYHQSKDGSTALHYAAWRGEPKMLKFLIEAGAKSYNQYAEDDIKSGGGEKIPQKMLLTMVDEQGDTALHRAVLNHKLEAVKMLVEADPNKELLRASDRKINTPLHLVVGLKSDLEIARLLIEADPDFPYGANSDGMTPLLIAIEKAELHNDRVMLKLIMELQPTQSMVSVNENGSTALHYSVSRKFVETIGYIIQSCPESSNVDDKEGQNFFHHAVKSGIGEMIEHILGMKEITPTVLNSPDNLGRTPFDIAAVSRNESIILRLHEDPRVNKTLTVAKNLHWIVERQSFMMMKMFIEPNADLLMDIELEVFQNSVDENGDTILFKAAQENHLFLCKEIYKRCPSLIYHQSKGGHTALHHAAWKGELKMLKFLIAAGAKSYNEYAEDDIESGGGEKIPQKKLLTMLDDQDDTALHRAVLNHKFEAVKLLVEADPDYEYGANTSSETPIMISVQEARSNENKFDTEKIRKLLFKMHSQTMARTGENNWTLLHQATFNGDLRIIEDIIKLCPSCLDAVDNEGKNFLHIAAKWGKIEVVRLVLYENDIPLRVLNREDNYGNTPLHIAAMNENEPLTKCFLFDPRVDKTTVNKAGRHVLKAINFPYGKRKAGVFGITDTVDESDLKDQRDLDLVVGALIATVSFTAGITVPGGFISEGPNQGMAVLSKKGSFAAFIISNTFALIFSLYAVFSHFCARRMREEANVIYQLNVATHCTLAAIYCMMAAFIAGSFAVLANSSWLVMVVCIISCLFFIFACRPIWKIAMERKHAASASQQKRSS